MMRAIVVAIIVSRASVGAADDKMPLPPFVAVASVTATSFLANKKDPERYAPKQVLLSGQDGPPRDEEGPVTYSSMWCEGRPDEGVGETLTVTLAQPARIDALQIAAGVWKSERLFARNNMPTRLEVSVDGGAPKSVVVPSTRDRVSLALGTSARSIAIKIAAVKKGAINDTCLSSVALISDGKPMERLFGVSATAAAALPDAIRRIVAAVGANDAKELAAIGDFPITVETAANCDGTGNSETSTVTHKNAKAMQRDCAAYRKQDRSQEVSSRSDPCLTDVEVVDVQGGDGTVDVILHFICGYTFNPVYTLVWRGAAWKLGRIGARSTAQ